MGDIVLLEDEVSPAMSAALDNGLEVTALHNHFFFESPRVMYMHIGGSGDPSKLADQIKSLGDLSFTTTGLGRPRDVTLVPYYRVAHDRYNMYWKVLPS